MRRYLTWAALLVALLLAVSCRSAATETTPDADPLVLYATAKPATAVPAPATAVPTVKPSADPTAAAAEPVPAVDLEDPLAVRETDWVMGPPDAIITLLEYGDYL